MILELGASRSGDIEFLCELCRPTHGLVTSIGAAHLLGFGSIETVAATKGELYDFIAESGTAYVPLEDARCVQESDNAKTRRGFGFGDAPADWTDSYVAGTELRFDDQGCGKFKVDGVEIVMTIPGRPAAQSALAAISIALDHGISPEQCAARMHDVHYTGRRADVIRTATLTIVDDSYNANPVSMRAALETLILLPGRRRVAILGDMNELGRHSEDYHRQLGRDVGQLNVHRAAFVGGESHTSHEEALRTGVESIHVDRVEDLLPELPGLMEDADLVLIKGSRTMNLEQVVDELKRRAS